MMHLHKEDKNYRDQVKRKIRAYHIFLMFGCITQGLLLHLGINHGKLVWKSFNGWLRTIRNDIEPSEIVVSSALKTSFSNYLGAKTWDGGWQKFLINRMRNEHQEFERLYG